MNKTSPFKVFLRLPRDYPLHLFAATVSALISTILFSMQPTFMKIFINQLQSTVVTQDLMAIAIMMVTGAILAYFFDFIYAGLYHSLIIFLEKRLREIFYRQCYHLMQSQIDLASRKGIFGLSQSLMDVTLKTFLVLVRILVICFFLFTSHKIIAGVFLFFLLLMSFPTLYSIRKLGQLFEVMERSKGQIVSTIKNQDDRKSARFIRFLINLGPHRFNYDSILYFCSFFLFQLLPIGILFLMIGGVNISSGDIASTFLYFRILQRPYSELVQIIKAATINTTVLRRILPELQIGYYYEQIVAPFNKGLFALQEDEKYGIAHDLIVETDRPKIVHLEKSPRQEMIDFLREEAKERAILVIGKKEVDKSWCHFQVHHNKVAINWAGA